MQLERFPIPEAMEMLHHLVCVANVNTGFRISNEIERSTWEKENGNIFNISERGNLILLLHSIIIYYVIIINIALVKSRSILKIRELCKGMEASF